VVRVVPEDEMVQALVETAERIVADGADAVLADAEAGAAREAAAARVELLRTQGEDPNRSEERIARIRDLTR
jgi:(E)-4-hydroxy-3-methylbut-2-enyl-diphosphate synthase